MRVPKTITDEIWQTKLDYFEGWIKKHRAWIRGDATVKVVHVKRTRPYKVKGRAPHVRYVIVLNDKK